LKFFGTQTLTLHQTLTVALGISKLLTHSVSPCLHILYYVLIHRIDAENVSLTIASTDRFVASALVRHGVIPCSPISPSVAISIDALELYRVARLRNPHFSIQAYVKSICDLHGVSFFAIGVRISNQPFPDYLS
jgi:hypothetical protein